MVYQCGIIFGFLAIGELIVWLTGIKLPSSIIGMLLLTACLQLKWIRLRWVEGIANFLVKNLGFFFIPPGVALMLHLNVIKAQLLPIIVASAVSTVVVIVVTGWIHQLVVGTRGGEGGGIRGDELELRGWSRRVAGPRG